MLYRNIPDKSTPKEDAMDDDIMSLDEILQDPYYME